MGLAVRELSGGYGSVPVVRGATFHVDDGETVAVLGRNGSGKTTLLRGLMGLLPRCSGSVLLNDRPVDRASTHERARAGIAYVPQGRDIFSELTVEENLRLGHVLAGRRMSAPLPAELIGRFSWIPERLAQAGGTLSGGQQQMLAVMRMLIAGPQVLLLDEPTEGLAPAIIDELADLLADIVASEQMSILVVEQNVAFALRLARRGYIMDHGEIVAAGTATELTSDEMVDQYLSV
ncbi:MAG: ABC transporter ATP-binding protein [Acidimicrobiia bacterium]|nr:ABC transporter ATP-binding protein [Acidimicrobiia bacterium]